MTTKKVFQCDEDGVYLAPSIADENPLEPGVFLSPAGCVDTPPPTTADKEAAQWDGVEWKLVEDYRGETWYRGQEAVVVESVGNPREQGLSLVPVETPVETTEPSLAELKVTKLAAIIAKAQTLLDAGSPATNGLHVELVDSSRSDLNSLALAASSVIAGNGDWTATFPDYAKGWISIENTRIPLATAEDAWALAVFAGSYYAAVIQHRRDLKDATMAAEDVETVNAIDVNTGWPAS